MSAPQISLRHLVATLAYRAEKVLRDAPAGFGAFHAGGGSRTAGEILAHVGDGLAWAVTMVQGHARWQESPPQEWEAERARFFRLLGELDQALTAPPVDSLPAEALAQGPLADALTHIGQLALLRRLAAAPVRAENYSRAEVVEGRVGPQQSAPRREF